MTCDSFTSTPLLRQARNINNQAIYNCNLKINLEATYKGQYMKGSARRNPIKLFGLRLVSIKRHQSRLKRKGKSYGEAIPYKTTHSVIVNPNYIRKKSLTYFGDESIKVPNNLNSQDENDWDQLSRILMSIRSASLEKKLRRVIIDFSECEFISPEAALAIVAEIQRCKAFRNKKTKITGTYPRSSSVTTLLTELGFFRALKVKGTPPEEVAKSRFYVQIERHNQTQAELINKLLSCFEKVFNFAPRDKKRLHIALLESMDNVYEHAYSRDSIDPDLIREWWLAGYSDESEGSISFIFYDQGSGIPSTIRRKKEPRIIRLLQSWSDDQWIFRAITKPISRHDTKRRGHGLGKLKEFIEGDGINGSLRVISNHGAVTFESNGASTKKTLREKFSGTLVSWKLTGISVTSPQP